MDIQSVNFYIFRDVGKSGRSSRDYCVDVAKGRGELPFGLVGQESTCD